VNLESIEMSDCSHRPSFTENDRSRLAKSLTLSVLKRRDPTVSSILVSSPHVCCYRIESATGDFKGASSGEDTVSATLVTTANGTHSPAPGSRTGKPPVTSSSVPWRWTKLEVEGPLHLIERLKNSHDGILRKEEASNGDEAVSYQLVVLNRKGMDDLVAELPRKSVTHNTAYEVDFAHRLISFKNGDGDVYGIWFAEMGDCERIANVIEQLQTEQRTEKISVSLTGEIPKFIPGVTTVHETIPIQSIAHQVVAPDGRTTSGVAQDAGQHIMNMLGIAQLTNQVKAEGSGPKTVACALNRFQDAHILSREELARLLYDILYDRAKFEQFYEAYRGLHRPPG